MSEPKTASGGKEMLVRLFGPSLNEVSAFVRGLSGGGAEPPLCWDEGVEVVVRCSGGRMVNDLCDRFGDSVYSLDGRTMAHVVGALLAAGGHTVGTAESCTGGLAGQLLTSVAGSSEYYVGGFVTYSNRMKARLLGVPPLLLERFGAVSEEVALAMALGARERLEVDVAVSISGVAGPSGGSDTKPVGTVCFGLASAGSTLTRTVLFKGDRQEIRLAAATCALDMVRRWCVDRGRAEIVLDVAAPDGLN